MSNAPASAQPMVGINHPEMFEGSFPLVELSLDTDYPDEVLAGLRARADSVSLHGNTVSPKAAPKILRIARFLPVHHVSFEPNLDEPVDPFTLTGVNRLCLAVDSLQSKVNVPILLQNLFSSQRNADLEISETRLVNLLQQRVGCALSLDLARIYTQATNRCFNPYDWLDQLNLRHVRSIHLSGTRFTDDGAMMNCQSTLVAKGVWDLYRYICKQVRPPSTVLQWDTAPRLVVAEDVRRAQAILNETAMYHFDLRSMGAPYQGVVEGGAA